MSSFKYHLLFDTNVLINIFKHEIVKNAIKAKFYDNEKYILTLNEIISAEFEIGNKNNLLNWDILKSNFSMIPIFNKVYENSFLEYKKELLEFNIKNNSNCTPKSADALIGCQIKQHSKSGLRLLTLNHKDFPVPIFEREETFWVDVPGDPKIFAIYKYNENRKV